MSVIEDALRQAEQEDRGTRGRSAPPELSGRSGRGNAALDDQVTYAPTDIPKGLLSPHGGAQAKGRSAVEWAAVALVIIAIAAVLTVVLPASSPQRTTPEAGHGAVTGDASSAPQGEDVADGSISEPAQPGDSTPPGTGVPVHAGDRIIINPARTDQTETVADGENTPPPSVVPSDGARRAELAARYRLTGIIAGAGRSYAVINGVMVTRGQQIDGAEVIRIDSSVVRLRVDRAEVDVPMTSGPGAGHYRLDQSPSE